jgi:hypothetical protein
VADKARAGTELPTEWALRNEHYGPLIPCGSKTASRPRLWNFRHCMPSISSVGYDFLSFWDKNKFRVGRPLCQFRDSFLRSRNADNGQQENNSRPIISFSNALIQWPCRRFAPVGYCLSAELTAIWVISTPRACGTSGRFLPLLFGETH